MAQVRAVLSWAIILCADFVLRIFRTDYGHTEVAAHFGNGGKPSLESRLLLMNFIDPREYCISTKEFVVDNEGKLKGLNTGTFRVEF
jgi:hypothetical protein